MCFYFTNTLITCLLSISIYSYILKFNTYTLRNHLEYQQHATQLARVTRKARAQLCLDQFYVRISPNALPSDVLFYVALSRRIMLVLAAVLDILIPQYYYKVYPLWFCPQVVLREVSGSVSLDGKICSTPSTFSMDCKFSS